MYSTSMESSRLNLLKKVMLNKPKGILKHVMSLKKTLVSIGLLYKGFLPFFGSLYVHTLWNVYVELSNEIGYSNVKYSNWEGISEGLK